LKILLAVLVVPDSGESSGLTGGELSSPFCALMAKI